MPARATLAVAPISSYPELFRGRKVIHFIDNSGACAALIKGYASAIDCGLIVNAYHAMAISLGCTVYIAHVRSKRNIADPPSREAPEEATEILQQVGIKRRKITYDPSPKLPSLEQWEEPTHV